MGADNAGLRGCREGLEQRLEVIYGHHAKSELLQTEIMTDAGKRRVLKMGFKQARNLHPSHYINKQLRFNCDNAAA